MIVLPVARSHIRAEVEANLLEYLPQRSESSIVQHTTPVFGGEDQMHMKGINDRPTTAKVACIAHRPSVIGDMLLRKANTFRLYPAPEQARQMTQIAGGCRFVYNLALDQRRTFGRRGRIITFASQCREVTALRAEVDWLKACPVHTLQQALRDLDRAYQNWWAGRAEAPTPRKKGLNDSFRFPDPVSIKVERTGKSAGRIKLPKLGWVPFRGWYPIPGDICNVTVSRRAGQWRVAVQWEREAAEPAPSDLPPVGIDRGVTVFAALSDGTMIAPVNHGKKALRSLARAQRRLARKRRGSNNRRKQVSRVARIQMRVANARKDFLHKASTTIAKNHGVVVLEDLEVRNMVRSAKGTAEKPGRNVRAKAGLNRSILDQGWGQFAILLAYKLADRGGRLIKVPPRNTSRTCGECGVVDAASRSGLLFRCIACGHEAHADTNAAIEILRRADLPVAACEALCARQGIEAGTTRRIAA